MSFSTLYDILCCPACRGDLEYRDTEEFHCVSCQFTFPIIDGIPVLFPRNVKEEMDELFGRYWDSDEKAHRYHEALEEKGDIFNTFNLQGEIDGLVRFWNKDKLGMVLDAGCGDGRFLELLPEDGIKIGLDASLNLLKITKSRGKSDLLICGELEHLPIRDAMMDTVFSCRVIQHLHEQEKAVHELARVTRDKGDVIFELYNSWNLKTVYKKIRMTPRVRKVFNAPFTLLFRSMSPFGDWGISYDRYNNWFQVKRWMRTAKLNGFTGIGIGWGWHKYLWDPFHINGMLQKRAPDFLTAYYRASRGVEHLVAGVPPIRYTMEKFTLRGTKNAPEMDRSVAEKVVTRIRTRYKTSAFNNKEALQEEAREASPDQRAAKKNLVHMQEAIDWIKRAHDATDDGGVARAYGVAWIAHMDLKGWQPSYPETTGYIIPTFYDAAGKLDDDDLRCRAAAMADWEVDVQMPSGAVMGGVLNPDPSPAVFNTGQVMLGWLRAGEETGNKKYLEASDRAAAFLLDTQSADGAWRRGNSRFVKNLVPTYNARTGWALILHGLKVENDQYVEAGRKNMDYVISQQEPNGWFRNNCLSDATAPLMHTISYTIEGLLGAYDELAEPRYLDSAKLAADHLKSAVPNDGNMPGRLDHNWDPRVEWNCLTGSAQLAGVLLRLGRIVGDASYTDSARRLLRFVKSTQNCDTDQDGLRGGIKGSYPFGGDYGRYEVLNWSTKFFIDALLLDELAVESTGG